MNSPTPRTSDQRLRISPDGEEWAMGEQQTKDPSDIELSLQSVMLDDDQSHRAMALAELVAHMPITAARELVYLRAKLCRGTFPMTNTLLLSIDDPDVLRAIKDNLSFENAELYRATPDGHKFSVGQVCILTGLEDFPEYNGEEVTITSAREDGHHGKAYYISGRINEVMNWVYEYRLSPAVQS